jgi:HK97 family phage prohead protease
MQSRRSGAARRHYQRRLRLRNNKVELDLPRNTLFRFAPISPLGDLEFEGVAATDGLKDDGYQLDMSGADISRFKDGRAPLLLQHDPNKIVGTASLRKAPHALMLRGKFASPGVSDTADQARRLLKDGVLNSISLGFSVSETERLGKSPRDGIRATKWVALECSLVAVPLDPEAIVTARAARLLGRSGRRLSAETQRSLRAALAHHRTAMRCQRDAADVIEDLLRDADMDMMGDDSERARSRLRLAVLRRRWDPAWLARMAAVGKRVDRTDLRRKLARLKAIGREVLIT